MNEGSVTKKELGLQPLCRFSPYQTLINKETLI